MRVPREPKPTTVPLCQSLCSMTSTKSPIANQDARLQIHGCCRTTVEIICREPTADAVGITGMSEHVLFTAAAVSSWCEACVHPTTFHVNPMTYVSRSESNAAVMRPVDWIALVFSSYMVGLTVAGEVKDIRICEIARERAGDAIAPQWRRALILTNGARRWIFLCAFGWIIPNLVALKGGDALNS